MNARNLCACALLYAGACGADTHTVAATQLVLRIQDPERLRDRLEELRIETAIRRGKTWHEQDGLHLSAAAIEAWPVDVLIEARGEDIRAEVELVASALGPSAEALAQARVLSNFVPYRALVLPLVLRTCDGQGPNHLCVQEDPCHGARCLTCSEGECAATPEQSGQWLEPFALDASITELDTIVAADDGGAQARPMDAGAPATETEVAAPPDADASPHADDPEVAPGEDASEVDCRHDIDRPRCDDQAPLLPLICNAEGRWEPSAAALDGGSQCPYACREGACQGECANGLSACAPDRERDFRLCEGNQWKVLDVCDDWCADDGGCVSAKSCRDLPKTCGPGFNESCCTSRIVPGGMFTRDFDRVDYSEQRYIARLSPFRLDRFEVTVGRFARFLAVYEDALTKPRPGAGKNPHNESDPGWLETWMLPATRAEVVAGFASCDGTWRETSDDAALRLPINCVPWFLAQAFCIWDGGRLPTEAEWNFAAAGGDQQRVYPWSDPATNPDIQMNRAVYGPETTDPSVVGSKSPDGDGRWQHADLAGNLWEWVQDAYVEEYSTTECVDCAELDGFYRALRGGAYGLAAPALMTSRHEGNVPGASWRKAGFRCVRDL